MICPLYKEAVDAQPWQNARSAHPGLLFDKFAHAWDWKVDEKGQGHSPVPVFDAGDQHKKEKDKRDSEKQGYWIRSFPGRLTFNDQLLKELCRRQAELVDALGGQILCFTNNSRFVTGMGREHPLENGFTFHHTLGVPYLPASGLKGLLAAWLREECPDDWDKKKHRWKDHSDGARWFGTQDAAGQVTLLDMIPAKPPKLVAEIMTPHYGPYYQGGEAPGDWHSPTPIPFLAVETGQMWQVAIVLGPTRMNLNDSHQALEDSEMERLATGLREALDWLGAGAKTAVGYGRFQRDSASEEQARKEARERRNKEREARERQRELASLSPELAELQRRADAEDWNRHHGAFLSGVEHYIEENPKPPWPCVDWLKKEIEQRYPGIWENPDKTKGKRHKPVHKERPRNLVHNLKNIIG